MLIERGDKRERRERERERYRRTEVRGIKVSGVHTQSACGYCMGRGPGEEKKKRKKQYIKPKQIKFDNNKTFLNFNGHAGESHYPPSLIHFPGTTMPCSCPQISFEFSHDGILPAVVTATPAGG